MKSATRPTYAQIAEQAGVSEATVSRVLNGDEKVHPDRAKRVHAVVDALGYRKNRAATALASGRTGLIAIVIDDDLSVFSDPFWATVSSGISRVLLEHELQTLLLVAPMSSPDSGVAHYLEGGEVDGVIFFQLHKHALVKRLAKQGLPVVIAGSPSSNSDLIFADTDNFGGGAQATRHLLQSGCKNIATITGDTNASAGRQRHEGYLQAHREIGKVANKALTAPGDYSFESGKEQMKLLLDSHPDIDALFAANDLMALGAIIAIEESGRKVPDDVRVVGFDDSVMSQTSRPPLTTIRQDIVGLGAAVAELMIALLSEKAVDPRILPTELVIRESA